ncbi:MAG: VIT and VWA domain-containing protein [Pirellulales bacterium]
MRCIRLRNRGLFCATQLCIFTLLLLTACLCTTAKAWQNTKLGLTRDWCDNVIMPQSYRNALSRSARGAAYHNADATRLVISQIEVDVEIRDQMAQTKMLVTIRNPSTVQQTAELLMPVATGAVIRDFTFQGSAKEPATELLEAEKAKHAFQSIVAKLKDPALLEFAGYNMIRSSVFPVPASGEQRVQLVMEQLLSNDNHRIDYLLPRSQSLSNNVPWKISAKIKSSANVATVYSPSHQVAVQRVNDRESSLIVPEASMTPGSFRLSYLQSSGSLTASLMTSPELNGKNGHFLLLAGLTQDKTTTKKVAEEKLRREVTLVLDRSASMAGEKIEQAKQAALQVISGLEIGESFNIVAFCGDVELFAQKPVVKSIESQARAIEFIQSMTVGSGTNIYDALQRGLAQETTPGRLPIVLFLTDGLPTVGNVSEAAIREVVEKQNKFNRRIFSFGVGFDVNTPLLDKLATSTRGFATFVTPGENVEVAVSKVFRGLNGPTLSDVRLDIADQPTDQPSRIHEILPQRLPDLYEGDQLIVLGAYRGDQPLKFRVTANRGAKPVTFDFQFDPKQNQGQAFVSRLWASRKIASLIDQVRDLGASEQTLTAAKLVNSNLVSGSTTANKESTVDPRLAELTDSIVAFSKQYGILTEYTSFLATEGVDLSNSETVKKLASSTLLDRAVACRTGIGSLNQELNSGQMRGQTSLNVSNRYVNHSGQWVTTSNVQQCSGNALYNRGGRWVEAQLVEKPKIDPDATIDFGSEEFLALLWKMVALGRQDELAVEGEILITVEGKTTLVRGLKTPEANTAQPSSDSSAAQQSQQPANPN